ncbi:MAG TPA: histidine phosphatase family protein [Terracidiphilus sp.]|nr:histidine phosphatase family protein [Terracidiphilus sp.]
MRTFVFIRHAQTAMAGRFCGQSDPELDAAGTIQLAHVVQNVARLGIQRIVSSDLRRASQTAQTISQHLGLRVEFRPALREIHFGLWEGLSWAEIEAQFPGDAQSWIQEFPMQPAPRGERYADFTERIDDEFDSLLSAPDNPATAVVTHRGVMRYALTRFFGLSEEDASTQTDSYGVVIPAVYTGADRARYCHQEEK